MTATPSRGTALVRFELIDGTLRGRLQLDSHETASFDNEAELVSALIARARRERHRSQIRVVVEPAATVPALGRMEWMMAKAAAGGASNRDIAADTFYSVKSVEAYLTRVYRKLGVSGRAELVRLLAARPDHRLA